MRGKKDKGKLEIREKELESAGKKRSVLGKEKIKEKGEVETNRGKKGKRGREGERQLEEAKMNTKKEK